MRTAVRVAGLLLAAAAVAFCAVALVREWHDVSDSLAHANYGLLALGLLAAVLAMAGLGVLWWRCLLVFGAQVSKREAVAWYFAGELGKYVPGGVWAVLGRGELARRSGKVSRGTGYATTLIGYGVMCVGAAVVCGALAPFLAAYGDTFTWAWAMLALLPLGLIAVHPVVFGRVLRLARRASKGRIDLRTPRWGQMLALVLWSVPTWVLVGLSSVAVTGAIGFDARPARIAFAAIAAWILGFLVVPVPAGAGLREVVFIAISGLGQGPGVVVAAGARLLAILADGIGGGAGLIYARALIRSGAEVRE